MPAFFGRATSIFQMDDYCDLIAAALALVFAGAMLIAGQLYLEYRARQVDGISQIPAPDRNRSSPMASGGRDARPKISS
jgi:TRAP-type C4-dicarboxylate transport system permease small subunit